MRFLKNIFKSILDKLYCLAHDCDTCSYNVDDHDYWGCDNKHRIK